MALALSSYMSTMGDRGWRRFAQEIERLKATPDLDPTHHGIYLPYIPRGAP